MVSLVKRLEPVFNRVDAKNVREYGDEVRAIVYDMVYSFKLDGTTIKVNRGELSTQFDIEEIEVIDHIYMPFIVVLAEKETTEGIMKRSSDDTATRLHLVMKGDLYSVTEHVSYINAGTQQATNYCLAI
jgi:hypothetical protein